MSLRDDVKKTYLAAIAAADPYNNTLELLKKTDIGGAPTVIALGKAAVPMARAASEHFGGRIKNGLCITKYEHARGFSAEGFTVIEAGHPVSDGNSAAAAEAAQKTVSSIKPGGALIALISGGGSALMEKSFVPDGLYRDISEKLLARGAEISEINAVRKRLSSVKGGKLAALCYPAPVYTFVLSDVVTNDLGVIASGPTVPDDTPDDFVNGVAEKYLFDVPDIKELLKSAEEIRVNNAGCFFAGDLGIMRDAAVKRATELGYSVFYSEKAITGEAREVAVELLRKFPKGKGKTAFIFAGETTVTLKGKGRGGRNQEAALAAAIELDGKEGVCFASVGSDGTDGPTDAAGGLADGASAERMRAAGLDPKAELQNNNAYYALKASGDLIITGPTGTNVNDLMMIFYG